MTGPQAKTLWNRNEIRTKSPLAKSHHSPGPDRTRATGGLEDGRFAREKGALHGGLGSTTNWPHETWPHHVPWEMHLAGSSRQSISESHCTAYENTGKRENFQQE